MSGYITKLDGRSISLHDHRQCEKCKGDWFIVAERVGNHKMADIKTVEKDHDVKTQMRFILSNEAMLALMRMWLYQQPLGTVEALAFDVLKNRPKKIEQ